MSGEKGGVQVIVKEKFDNAHFVHCYAHQLNLIMERAASQDSSVRIFFAGLSGIPSFFSRSPQRLAVLDTISNRIPRGSNTRWNFKSRVVNTVFENKESLIECFKELQQSRQSTTVQQASGLLRMLEDETFLFWLHFFHRVMPHVDILYAQMQSRNMESVAMYRALDEFYRCINNIRNDPFLEIQSNDSNDTSSGNTRTKFSKKSLKAAAKEVCDSIVFQAKERFNFIKHLSAAQLFVCDNFKNYAKQFPTPALNETVEAYPILNKDRLLTELSVLYDRAEFQQATNAAHILKILIKNDLQESFREVVSLLKIVLTTPMTTAEPERCFSTLKRILTFLRSTMAEERLSALSMLSIEKNMVAGIPDFNDKVIDLFSSRKNRRLDFFYK